MGGELYIIFLLSTISYTLGTMIQIPLSDGILCAPNLADNGVMGTFSQGKMARLSGFERLGLLNMRN